jgi:hypothetical protein
MGLTIKEAIEIQTQHLNDWETKLKPEVFEALREFAIKDNDKKTNGYDICRGTDLDNFIANYKPVNIKRYAVYEDDSFYEEFEVTPEGLKKANNLCDWIFDNVGQPTKVVYEELGASFRKDERTTARKIIKEEEIYSRSY